MFEASHGLPVANGGIAVGASVFLVVECRHAEWDQAATEPQTEDAAQKANQPSKSSFLFCDRSHSRFTAVLACTFDWVLWPNWNGCRRGLIHHDNSWLLGWCHLVLNRLSVWSVLDGLALWVWLGLSVNHLGWSHILLVSGGHWWLLLWLLSHKGLCVWCLCHLTKF